MANKRLTRMVQDAVDAMNECISEIDTLEDKVAEHENHIDQLKEQISDLQSELKENQRL